jgi:hypothetical protein
MQLSWKVILAPLIGAFFSWLAGKGLTVTPDQQTWLLAGGATVATWLGHLWNEWTQSKATAMGANQQGGTGSVQKSFLLMVLLVPALLGISLGSLLEGCASLPTNTAQQAGVSAAIDVAVGIAVQAGEPQGAWAPRAAAFEKAAKSLQAVNAAGATTLATLAADLQPFIAKLGPADVLAANALVGALQPILTALLGSNPTAGNVQKDIALVLQDVITACALYTGS